MVFGPVSRTRDIGNPYNPTKMQVKFSASGIGQDTTVTIVRDPLIETTSTAEKKFIFVGSPYERTLIRPSLKPTENKALVYVKAYLNALHPFYNRLEQVPTETTILVPLHVARKDRLKRWAEDQAFQDLPPNDTGEYP
jgi:hypothetical protein